MTRPASLNLTDVSPFRLPGGSGPLDRNQRVSWPGSSSRPGFLILAEWEVKLGGSRQTRNQTDQEPEDKQQVVDPSVTKEE